MPQNWPLGADSGEVKVKQMCELILPEFGNFYGISLTKMTKINKFEFHLPKMYGRNGFVF